MACGGSKILLCLGLVLFSSSFCYCATLTKLKALGTLSGNSMLSQGKVERSNLRHGRLIIGDNSLQGPMAAKKLMDIDTDYQADMGWGQLNQPIGWSDGFSRLKPDNSAAERLLLKMEPKVECTGDFMKLQVHDAASTTGSLFVVDRGSHLSPLPLSKLPPSCGYTIRSTQRELVLVAPYDGCFVTLEEDRYVLPLRWWGVPVRMSCPLMRQSSPNPPTVNCYTEGMVVKTEWTVSVAKIKVNLTGAWEPLMNASPRCGFSVVVHPEGVVISVRYTPCMERQDGMYTLKLAGEGETKISCPSPAQSQPTTRAPEPTPETPAQTPPVPVSPQNPVVTTKKPSPGPKDIKAPQGPHYPYPFYPYPFYPHPEPGNQPAKKPSPVPKPPPTQGQVQQPFYPYPFYPRPEPGNQPAKKPSPVPKPPPTQAPHGQVQQPFHPYLFYPQPEPENPPSVLQVPTPSYPLPSKIPGAGTNCGKAPTEKPVQIKQPPVVKPPERQVHPFFNPYYYHHHYYPQQPLYPQPVTSPATTMQQTQQVTTPASIQYPTESYTPQPTNGGIVPPDFPHACPQFCPSGYNCCPQIAFHQYLYPVIPAGLGSKDAPPVYSGLPSSRSVANFGFSNGLGSFPLPQNPTEATTTQAATSAKILPWPLPYGNAMQAPDGNPAVPRRNPSMSTNPEPIYPYLVPGSLHHNWPYLLQNEALQNLAQSQSPSNPWAPGHEPVNPVGQYDIQPPKQQNRQLLAGDMKNPSGFNFMSFNGQYLQEDQNKPPAKELQPSNEKSSDSKGPTHPEVQSEADNLLVPYYMLQDAQAPTYNKSVLPNYSPQSFVSDSQKSKQTARSHSEPKSYMLLRHGPPGREPNRFSDSPLPSRVRDSNILAQNFARQESRRPQYSWHLKAPQENSQHPKWLGKMSNPLPDINYMPRPGDKSEGFPLFYSTPDSPQFVSLSQDPSLSVSHLRPKFPESFQNFWKPRTPLGSSLRIPPHGPGNAFQQWNSAADHQANGLDQPLQREGGKQK